MTERTTVDQVWTVGQVAHDFDVTVRTLHHYDEVGLLTPSERSLAGYRLYTEADLERLATIVVYRRLGLALDDIADLLAGEGELVDHLRRQRAAVMSRLEEMHDLVAAIDHALEREMNDEPATTEELKELFGDGFTDEYQAEAEERWGDTDAWRQSRSRTSRYTTADWAEVKAEMEAVNEAFAAAMNAGEPATGGVAMDAAEAHRMHIHTRFYDLDHEFHRKLAEMYVSDPRFTRTYDDIAPGFPQYVHDAITANADRHAGR